MKTFQGSEIKKIIIMWVKCGLQVSEQNCPFLNNTIFFGIKIHFAVDFSVDCLLY